ncbi:metallophosphoesterase [uncultured Desulfobacter sp.]|uniref:metallophosphoesterase n=1 Tax=uncultured Desulfobacter sp. TaxID=240139 RepID=UPI002AAB74DF|nr:metallophosphoesterase [uncultured Desulfobacter sp.]
MKRFVLILLLLVGFCTPAFSAEIVGQWDFDDSSDMTRATIGPDLVLTGSHTSVSGHSSGDYATSIGLGSYYTCNNEFTPNGGGSYVNNYTLVYDIKCSLTSGYSSLLQTNQANSNDGEIFTKSNGAIGVGDTGYAPGGTIEADTWTRIVVRVKNGELFEIWKNGTKVLDGNPQSVDGRFGIEEVFHLFRDNDGEEETIEISKFVFYDGVLTEEEIVALGGVREAATLVGQWDFENPDNLTLATIGKDLTRIGSDSAVEGINSEDGAARIGVGSYYSIDHGITPADGETNVNQWSLVVDFTFSESDNNTWKTFFQTNPSNFNDGDCFINEENAIGVSATGYSNNSDNDSLEFTCEPGEWYRLVAVIDNNSGRYDLYINGELVLDGVAQEIDGRFSLEETLLLFADENGEDNSIDVSLVQLYDAALTSGEVADLQGPGGVEPPKTLEFLTEPYLQNVKKDGITIMWETSIEADSSVEYSTDESLDYSVVPTFETNTQETVIYKAVLTGLSPDTKYNFRVTADDLVISDLSFKTAPEEKIAFSFGVWADSQGTNHATFPDDLYEPTKTMMAHMAGNVDIGVSVGDLAEDGNSYTDTHLYYLDRVAKYLGKTRPWFNAWGNHDKDQGAMIRQFADMPSKDRGEPYDPGYGSFMFEYAGCYFICIDNACLNVGELGVVESMLMEARENSAKHIFVFIHKAPYYERWYEGEESVRFYLVPLLEEYKVDILFSGHTHAYQRGYLNGVYYCVTGGGSWLDTSEPLTTDWEHMTVGGYHDLADGIDGGLVNEYVRVDVTDNGYTAHMVAFEPSGEEMPDVTDDFGSPNFKADSINFPEAIVNEAYEQDLSEMASDPDNRDLVFSMIEGPEWLSVDTDGILFGTPSSEDIGLNTFKIRVENDRNGYDIAEVQIRVSGGLDLVTDLVNVEISNTAYNRRQKTYSVTAELENVSNTTVSGPLNLVITDLSPGDAQVEESDGSLDGSPYIEFLGEDQTFSPGEILGPVIIKITTSSRVKLHFNTEVYGKADPR